MKTVVMKLSGVFQSWGTGSKFNHRGTDTYPSKSGLIGLLGCCMGIERTDTGALVKLKNLRFTIRVDNPGDITNDFHTSHIRDYATGDISGNALFAENRDYLQNAVFMVAINGEDNIIDTIAEALKSPQWAPYLGRKDCVPDKQLFHGVYDNDDVIDVFKDIPLQSKYWEKKHPQKEYVPLIGDGIDGIPTEKNDEPESFDLRERKYSVHSFKRGKFILPKKEEEDIESLFDGNDFFSTNSSKG